MSQQPEKFEATSVNITDEQKAKLKSLFPEIVTEGGKIDFDRLKLTLGDAVDAGKERYGMNWPGKADCFKTIQRPSMATLVPARDESVNFDTTENLIIEGDNLETLKLLQKAYLGKVKMIYIDPPYNTGNDFIYPDDFSESLETYLRYTGQADAQGRKYSTNSESDGRFHSKWLNMMYPRLFIARNLLHENGVMFISIDDGEVANVRRLCDEVFGEDNFAGTIVWKKKTNGNNMGEIPPVHDYIVCYAKHLSENSIYGFPISKEYIQKEYANPDNDPKGDWTTSDLSANHEGPYFAITNPKNGEEFFPSKGRYWVFNETEVKKRIADGRIIFGKSGDARPVQKKYLSERTSMRIKAETWWDKHGLNEDGTEELGNLVATKVFNHSKPSILIKHIVNISTKDDEIVLDFFAGSGTTAHAVLEKNKEDGGNRKFILVQLPEPTERKDFKNISDIAKERVRAVIKKLNQADKNQLPGSQEKKQDRGFKVFKLQSSNFKAWNTEQPKDDAELVKQLSLHVDHLVAGRTQDDVLYELLLKSGFPLDTKVEKISLAGKDVFSIADGAMLICLEKELTPEVIKAMAEKKPERVVCLDAGFADNDQLKTNAVQTMKSKGVTKFQTV